MIYRCQWLWSDRILYLQLSGNFGMEAYQAIQATLLREFESSEKSVHLILDIRPYQGDLRKLFWQIKGIIPASPGHRGWVMVLSTAPVSTLVGGAMPRKDMPRWKQIDDLSAAIRFLASHDDTLDAEEILAVIAAQS
ncbi:MAG: hypothetical protein KC496_15065 [Anaerolineae bacterium]|nr:hypothetical protein [Anaerolineae bacterium]